jgi:hypothetical protein
MHMVIDASIIGFRLSAQPCGVVTQASEAFSSVVFQHDPEPFPKQSLRQLERPFLVGKNATEGCGFAIWCEASSLADSHSKIQIMV